MDDFNSDSAPWNDCRDTIAIVVVKDGVTSIGTNAFDFCQRLISVLLPESVTVIGECCFFGCAELRFVNIPHGVTAIREWTFQGCDNLRKISIPASVTFISEHRVFGHCRKLEKITVSEGNPSYTSVDGILFNRDKTALICYPGGKAETSYTIPDSVTHLADYAFERNENIHCITVPGSVKTIGSNCFTDCSKLTSLVLSEGIESIGRSIFVWVGALTAITLPSSLSSLVNDLFDGFHNMHCWKLNDINMSDDSSNYKSVDGVLFTSDMTTLVAYPAGRKDCSYVIPDGVTTIGECAFFCNCNITSVTFPDSLVAIGCLAFYGCRKLTGLQLPSGLRSIGDWAFYRCDGLTSVVLPASVCILGAGAFARCENLVSVTVMNPSLSFDDKCGVFEYGNKGLVLTGAAGSQICPSYNATMDRNKFCSECGTVKPKGQKCAICGYEVEEGKAMKYCPECGTKFE